MKNKRLKRKGAAAAAAVLTAGMVIPSMAFAAGPDVKVASDSGVQMSSDPEVVYVNNYTGTARSENFNNNWKFYLGDASGADAPEFDDSSWAQVNLPHDYSIEQEYSRSMEGESGYLPGGTGWYRKSFTLDESAAGKEVRIDFGGVYMDSSVWVNGHPVGSHPYGYTPFSFDITEYVKAGEENVITVRVNHQTPSSRWYSGSGIYRSVDLTITDPVHVDLYGTKIRTPDLEKEAGGTVNTDISAAVVNDSGQARGVTLTHTIFPKDGNTGDSIGTVTTEEVQVEPGEKKVIDADVPVSQPQLWSTDHPALYTVRTEVKIGDQVVDTYDTEYGFRYFSFDSDNGFSLNGEKMKLKGVCMHHDQGSLGSEAWDRAVERQVELLKKMGCNSIRVTHNPAANELIEACNEQGILVVEEAFDGWAWAKNGNGNDYARFFNAQVGEDNKILGAQPDMSWAKFDLSAMIRRGQNAPSIIMWSLGNEVQEGAGSLNQQYADIQTRLSEWAKELDDTRLTTRGCNVIKNANEGSMAVRMMDSLSKAGGAAGFNYASGGQYDTHHNNHPDWLIYGSETASAVNSRGVYDRLGNGGASQTSDRKLTSYDNSAVGWGSVASSAWYEVIKRDFVAGEYVWTGFDYIGEPTPWNGTNAGAVGAWPSPKNSYFGIIDTAGFPKDTYYFYQSQWNDSVHTLHILPAWNENVVTKDQSGNVPVVVYTDAAKAELFFTPAGSGEAQSLGVKEFETVKTPAGYQYQIYKGEGKDAAEHKNLYLTWKVPYADGTITAKAWDADGAEIDLAKADGRTSVTTAGKAAKLRVNADRTEIGADGADLTYITAEVTDQNGNLVPDAENNVKFKVEGEGRLIGVDNGRQDDHQSYQDNNRNAFAGKVLAVIQSSRNAGEIKVTAGADGLESSEVTVRTTRTGDSPEQARTLAYYEMSRNYYVKTGNMPQLPASVKAVYSDGSAEDMAVEWEDIAEDSTTSSGTFSVMGTTAAGDKVSVMINMIDQIAALLNYSTTVPAGQEPVLPESRPAVLQNGEVISASFPVSWGEPEGSYSEEGTVKLTGTADVLGQKLTVTASVRVQKQQITIGDSVTGAAYLSQDIESSFQSDTLDAVKDGNTAMSENNTGGANPSAWSNWGNTNNNNDNDAEITFRYDTQQRIGQAVVYFARDNGGLGFPDAGTTEIYISETGEEGSWTKIAAQETIAEQENPSRVKAYTYNFDPVTATYVKLYVKNPTVTGQKKRAVAITEVALNEWNGSYTTGTSAALASLKVNGLEVPAKDLEKGSFNTEAVLLGDLQYEAADNGAVTCIPVYEGKAFLIIESEDHSMRSKFQISLGAEPGSGGTAEDDSRDYDAAKTSASAASEYPDSENEGPAAFATDNNTGTWWHTDWSKTVPKEDFWITLKLDEETELDALRYYGRDGSPNGRVGEYLVEVSTDGEKWTPVSSGNWENTSGWKLAEFDQPVKAQYVRLTGVHTYGDSGNDRFMSAAEIRLRKTDNKTDISGADVAIGPKTVSAADEEHPVTLTADDITVRLEDGTVLRYGIDYIVSYENNTSEGTAKAVITGLGQYGYRGSVTAEFQITLKDPEITGIEVAAPCRTQYKEGDRLDPRGLELRVRYDDGTSENVSYGEETAGSFSFTPDLQTGLQKGDTAVTVAYGGFETTFNIRVDEAAPVPEPTPEPQPEPEPTPQPEPAPEPEQSAGQKPAQEQPSGNAAGTADQKKQSAAGEKTDRTKEKKAAQTGDNTDVLPVVIVLIICAAAAAAALILRIKRR